MIISSNAGSAAEDGTWAENPRCYCAVTNPRIQSEAARRRLTVMRHQRKLTREYQSDDRRCSLTSAALPALGIPRPIARLPSSAEALDKRFHIRSSLTDPSRGYISRRRAVARTGLPRTLGWHVLDRNWQNLPRAAGLRSQPCITTGRLLVADTARGWVAEKRQPFGHLAEPQPLVQEKTLNEPSHLGLAWPQRDGPLTIFGTQPGGEPVAISDALIHPENGEQRPGRGPSWTEKPLAAQHCRRHVTVDSGPRRSSGTAAELQQDLTAHADPTRRPNGPFEFDR